MKFDVQLRTGKTPGETLVLFVTQSDRPSDKALKQLDVASGGMLSSLFSSGEFTGKSGEVAVVTRPQGFSASRVLVAGVGSRKGLTSDAIRRAAGTVSRNRSLTMVAGASFWMPGLDSPENVQAAVEGYLLGSYKLLMYKSGEAQKSKEKLKSITILADDRRSLAKSAAAVQKGMIIAEGQNLVRDLAATPSNFLTPRMFAEKAQQLARTYKYSCKILDEKAIAAQKMGGVLSVAKGSIEPPRFIILEYKGKKSSGKPIVLVGKGVTFDSGGISIKPAEGMQEMKGDMTGGACVLSAITVAARLQLPLHIVALIPSVENMPSGTAFKPGDIITLRKGITVEITNTDAEGRLILSDALDYANEFKPQAVLDIATLTGAALFILGYAGAPIMGNDQRLLDRVASASKQCGEKVWQLPIWDEIRDRMKSSIADLLNSAGRPAGTIAAAAFLENSVGDYPWAHIDIAWVDIEPSGQPYIPKGPTGIGLRLLVEVLLNWKKI